MMTRIRSNVHARPLPQLSQQQQLQQQHIVYTTDNYKEGSFGTTYCSSGSSASSGAHGPSHQPPHDRLRLQQLQQHHQQQQQQFYNGVYEQQLQQPSAGRDCSQRNSLSPTALGIKAAAAAAEAAVASGGGGWPSSTCYPVQGVAGRGGEQTPLDAAAASSEVYQHPSATTIHPSMPPHQGDDNCPLPGVGGTNYYPAAGQDDVMHGDLNEANSQKTGSSDYGSYMVSTSGGNTAGSLRGGAQFHQLQSPVDPRESFQHPLRGCADGRFPPRHGAGVDDLQHLDVPLDRRNIRGFPGGHNETSGAVGAGRFGLTSFSHSSFSIGGSHAQEAPFDWMKKQSYPIDPISGKTRTKDKYRIVYTELQKVELEKEFLYNQYITIARKAELAIAIGLSDRQVKIWFQNRRAKERKHKKRIHDYPAGSEGGGEGGVVNPTLNCGGGPSPSGTKHLQVQQQLMMQQLTQQLKQQLSGELKKDNLSQHHQHRSSRLLSHDGAANKQYQQLSSTAVKLEAGYLNKQQQPLQHLHRSATIPFLQPC